jgi:hypothetical protein
MALAGVFVLKAEVDMPDTPVLVVTPAGSANSPRFWSSTVGVPITGFVKIPALPGSICGI